MGSIFNHVFSPLNIEFIGGMLCAFLYRLSTAKYFWIVPLSVGLFLFAVLTECTSHAIGSLTAIRVQFGIAFALIVYAATLIERNFEMCIPDYLIRLGDASYSIYLVHYPICSVVSRLVSKTVSLSSPLLNMGLCLFVTLLVGFTYHLKFEKPVLRFLRHKIFPANKVAKSG